MSLSLICNPDVALFVHLVTTVPVVFVALTVENIGVLACSNVVSCNLVDRNYLAVFLIYRNMGSKNFAVEYFLLGVTPASD
jgi:hypothetical protein